jgi:serine/threonine protein kinase
MEKRTGSGEEDSRKAFSAQLKSDSWWSKQLPFAKINAAPKSGRFSIGQRMPLELGEILNSRYRIDEILGQGGMGAVYKALDINLGVAVALKENLFITDEYARQFRREATILASLRHSNLPRVTDHFVFEGEGQYLVMDFVEGEDLREYLERNDAIPEHEALPWFLEICDALAYLHSRIPPIVHRDIKPGNIKITPEKRAILVDFGLAKVADGGVSTTTGAKAMTPGFSPPEQYGTGPTDARTDVYSLAATLYAALSGVIPEDALERAMGREVLTPVRHWNLNISKGVARAIEKALSISPDERYQTITEFAVALSAASASGMTTISRPLPHLEPTIKETLRSDTARLRSYIEAAPSRKRKWPLFVALLAAAVIVVAGVIVGKPSIERAMAGLFATQTHVVHTQRIPTEVTPQVSVTESLPAKKPTVTKEMIEESTQSPTAVVTQEATLPPTPAATPIGGGVGQIAFASDRDGVPQIYLINVDGTGITKLTNLQDGACQPDWSPDGNQLLFISPCRDNREQYPGSSIWLLSVDTLETSQLPTVPGGGDYDPAWGPDGERIAFTSLRDGWQQVYIMNLDGSDLHNISDGTEPDYQPAWDPRGTNLLLTAVRGAVSEILLMPDTGGSEQLFSMAESQGHSHADWSKDGQYILFERMSGNIPRLVVKKFDQRLRTATQVCQEGEKASQPMAEGGWSPDTQWITFETWPDGVSHDIAIMTWSCSSYAKLTDDVYRDFDPAWRP